MDHDRPGGKAFGHVDRIERIVDAFVERATVAAGKTTRPLHTRHTKARSSHQAPRGRHPQIGYLWPPDGDGISAMVNQAVHFFRQGPLDRCHLADREIEHAGISLQR
jgi:hypothetical protein